MENLHCYTDLHLHLEGSISLSSARALAKLQNIALPEDDAELIKNLRVDDDCADLNEFLAKFVLPDSLLQTKEGLQMATENLLRELKEDGLIYAEIRFAPQRERLPAEDAIEAVLAGIRNSDIYANCILSCMRGDTKQRNTETVTLAAKYLGKGVCAVDLAGAEGIYPTQDYEYIFELAKKLGVPYTIHAGEADGPESVKTAVSFGTKRIGHGVRAAEAEDALALLRDNGVTLELCPSSNLRTKIYTDIADYPIRKLMEYGIPVTVNTDDMSVIGTDIQTEYALLTETFGFSKDEIHTLLMNSVKASFADAELKEKLKQMIDADMGYTDQRKRIGIIAALPCEIEILKSNVQDQRVEKLAGSDFTVGTAGSYDVVIAQCGMGKVSAAACAQAMITRFQPDVIINTGCAGALADSLHVGDIVVAEKTVEWDLDTIDIGNPRGYVSALGKVEMTADEELSQKILAVIGSSARVTRGLIVSGDQFVDKQEQRRMILSAFPGALCAEMEGAAIGHVCQQNSVPFCVIRCISDNANGDSGVEFSAFSAIAGEKSAKYLLQMLNN